jgi:primosomal protein N' (replication factor Y)
MELQPAEYAIVAVDRPHGGQEEFAGRYAPANPALGLLLHYRIPQRMMAGIRPGHLVVVPVQGKPVYGVVVELAHSSPVPSTLPIHRQIGQRPVVSPAMLALAHWIATYYRCTLWQALAPMLPPGVARRAVTTVRLTGQAREDAGPPARSLGPTQQKVLALLKSVPSAGLTLSRLKRSYGGAASALSPALRALEIRGLVTRRTELPPPRSRPRQERIIRLAVPLDEAYDALRASATRAPLQAAVLDWLIKREPAAAHASGVAGAHPGPLEGSWHRLRDLYLHTGATSATVAALRRKGLVELSERTVYRRPVPPITPSAHDEVPPLTPAQAEAWREIAQALRTLPAPLNGQAQGQQQAPEPGQAQEHEQSTRHAGAGRTFLLHGVTGSGKTEIYLRAIGMALRMGRQALVLVPEISLTPQAVHRFAARFPGRVALIHSQLSAGQHFDEWQRIYEGHADIVIGSRSAVFAPLPRIGLIILDEEHEWAYKQQDHPPRYHAREVALRRAALEGCVVILGSATPDLATYHRAKTGKYRLLSLPARVGQRRARGGSYLAIELPMPQVRVVDMRAELRAGNHSIFSRALQTALSATLARHEQAILYLNRRGSNSFMLCRECGCVPLCPRCDVPLVYHADIYGMLCHRCNAFSLVPGHCPRCGSSQIKGLGVGTQRVVDEVVALFPQARVLRWDRDTASRQGGHAGIMEMFARGQADVLVGTQMIAKGLDLDRVTLVGVVSADTGLYLPDFRAPERTLQLLMQVAGRAGRRTETAHSTVVVQTFNPDHYAIQAAAAYDYKGFYSGEIRFRAEHGYPPCGQLARLVYSSESNERCEQQAGTVARYLRRRVQELEDTGAAPPGDIDVLGPAPCFVHKVRGRYRWQILIRATDVGPLLQNFHPGSGWAIDVDPVSVL